MKNGLVAANGGFVTLASDEFDESTLHLFEHERQAKTRRCGAFGEDDPGSLVIETGQDRRGAKTAGATLSEVRWSSIDHLSLTR